MDSQSLEMFKRMGLRKSAFAFIQLKCNPGQGRFDTDSDLR